MTVRRPATCLLLVLSALPACGRKEAAPPPAPAKTGGAAAPVAPAISTAPVSYDREIRPILSDKCFYCHGPDEKKRDSGLRLDQFAEATKPNAKSGKIPIVPGDPKASELLRRAMTHDLDDLMPPVKSGKPRLTAEEGELVARWIAEGAKYEAHWSFEAPVKPPVPAVKNAAWCRNEVDRFILSALEEKGIAPSPEADKATLLRRVSLDLTGLPPTPEEYEAFQKDDSADAYEKQVKRLLDSPRFGERMASYWCDAARYADTVGLHADEYHDYYRWRDWVVKSHNANLPFDKFLTDCLAGDLLENPTQDNLLGSIFVRLNPVSTEGGAIDEELRVEYAADRVDVVGTALLGISLKCARCHDHKFDPVSQADFFSMFAYFNSIEEKGLWDGGTRNQPVFGTSIALKDEAHEAAVAAVEAKIAALRAELKEAHAETVADTPQWRELLAKEAVWAPLKVEAASATGGAVATAKPDGSVLLSGPVPGDSQTDLVLRTDAKDLRLLRLEVLPDPSLPQGGAGRAVNGNAALSFIEVIAQSVKDPAKTKTLQFTAAYADYEQAGGDFDILNALRNDPASWAIGTFQRKDARAAYFLADAPFGFEGGTRLTVKLRHASPYPQHAFGRVRVSAAAAGPRAVQAVAPSWMVCGPFLGASRADAFAKAFQPEDEFDLSAVMEGGAVWQNRPDLSDGAPHALSGEHAAHFLARVVGVDKETKTELRLRFGGDAKVFVDGKEVFSGACAADKETAIPVSFAPGVHVLMLKLAQDKAGTFAFEAPDLDLSFPGAALALSPAKSLTAEQEKALAAAHGARGPAGLSDERKALTAAEAELKKLQAKQPRAIVTRELPKPRPTYVLERGEYDKPDKNHPVTRHPPRLGSVPTDDLPKNRLGLAQWMTHPANPLVSRVMVNRYWQLLFVNGLSKTSEDLGLQGEYPVNLPLLDFLSVQFREDGWDVKKTLERIVTSATYRQDSVVRPEVKAVDPENRLLAYFPRQRLAAEGVRDQALFVSGLLVEKVGGRGVKAYQPAGLWDVMALRGAPEEVRIYKQDHGEALYRRSLYTFWKRGCTPAQMVIFDAQDRGACTVRRPTTNTPMQALMLWNDPQFLEAARQLAVRTLEETDAEDARLAAAFRRCTGRAPAEGDLAALRKLLDAALARYTAAPKDAQALLAATGESPLPKAGKAADPAVLAAWTSVCSTLLSLDETLVRD